MRTDTWSKPSISEVYEEAGLNSIADYIHVKQMRITHYVATRQSTIYVKVDLEVRFSTPRIVVDPTYCARTSS